MGRTDLAPSGFGFYANHLSALVRRLLSGGEVSSDEIAASLDGESARQVRNLVPLDYRREIGAFFTTGRHREAFGEALADISVSRYVDPTCGAGDLLLSASNRLPLENTLSGTLKTWSDALIVFKHQER